MSEDVRKRLAEQDIHFVLTEEAKDWLSKTGFDPTYGARPLRRAIQKHIEDRLSEELLKGNFEKGDTVEIDVQGDELTVKKTDEVKANA